MDDIHNSGRDEFEPIQGSGNPEPASRLATRILILGSGPAGLTSAIYAARAGLHPILIHGIQPGGQMTTTTDVENFPGFRNIIQGPWLMDEMQAQAEQVGTRMIVDHIMEVDLSSRPFRLMGDSGTMYETDVLVIATGAQAKWLGIEGEEQLKGRGLSACATCDGFFFRGKKVAVIGGGDTAAEEALYLTNHSTDVTIVHRRPTFRAEQIMQQRIFANTFIKVLWNKVVEGFASTADLGLTGLHLRDTETGVNTTLHVDGAFVAIGHTPSTTLFKGILDLDASGYVKVKDGTTQTSVPGVFACGDVMDPIYRQAVTAAGSGCMAALDASRFLAEADFAEAARHST